MKKRYTYSWSQTSSRSQRLPDRQIMALLSLMTLSACDQTSIPPNADLSGAAHLEFRCLDLNETPARVAPLESCGCLRSSLSTEGERDLSALSREECLADNSYEVIGYLGSPTQQKIGVLHLDNGPRAILDQSEGIPGISHMNADDLISELMVHPYGDYLFTLNYTTGVMKLTLDHRELRPDLELDLGLGSLAAVSIWPTVQQALPSEENSSLLYVSAVDSERVYELDLDLISLALEDNLQGGSTELTDFALRSWEVKSAGGESRTPRLLSVNERGDRLAVSHINSPEIQIISLNEDADQESGDHYLAIDQQLYCTDSYLTYILPPSRAIETCQDGVDNDQDGRVDFDDEDCVHRGLEALNLSCPQLSPCADGIDNDGDDLIDDADPSCVEESSGLMPYREGQAPACDDGIDNDDDGLIDRADPGCEDQDDPNEEYTPERSSCFDQIDNDGDGAYDTADEDCVLGDDPRYRGDFNGEGDDLCTDGLDNDYDGLIDYRDPGCAESKASELYPFERVAECSDQVDNDGDGLIDYGQDPDCVSASDRREATGRLSQTPNLLELISLPIAGEKYDALLTHDADGALLNITLSEGEVLSRRTVGELVFPHTVERRVTGALVTLWVIDQSNSLSALHLTTPKPLLVDGLPVYARGEVSAMSSAEVDRESNRTGNQQIRIEALYVVDQGRAYELPKSEGGESILSYDPYTSGPVISAESAQELYGAELSDLTPLELPAGRGGIGDPQVFIEGVYELNHGRWNRNRTAIGQSNRVSADPRFSINGIQVSLNKSRHAGFCSMSKVPEGASNEEDNQGCVLIGTDPSGSTERLSDQHARRTEELESYEGIVVTESDYAKMISGEVNVTFEGVIPDSQSRTGQHISSSSESWVFADYQADFCQLGVEEGDLLVADRFYPLNEDAARDPECVPYLNRSPSEGEDPLRFRITAVSQRSLELTQDERLSYAPQLDLLGSSRLPKLAPSLPAPPFKCAAQSISYTVRAGQNQWLVNTQATGLSHPWEAHQGRCVSNPYKVQRKWRSRARLGELFENRWFKFQLGYQQALVGVSGISVGDLPTMVGAAFSFTLTRGMLNQLIIGAGILPNALRWLPERDRLYLVDGALKSVTEYEGADPYLDVLRIVQTFQ